MTHTPYESHGTFCGKCRTEMMQLSSHGMDGTVWKEFQCPECKTKFHQRIIYDERGAAYVSNHY